MWRKPRVENPSVKVTSLGECREDAVSWPVVSDWATQTDERICSQSGARSFSREQFGKSRSSYRMERTRLPRLLREEEEEEESWPELDKESTEEHVSSSEEHVSSSEEHVSSSEDMDTSLSSNDSPTPPLTSTPLARCQPPSTTPLCRAKLHDHLTPLHKPSMSFLYPSPDYESFPTKAVPSRPYSSLSVLPRAPAPSLPPKPASLASLFTRSSSLSSSNSTCSSGFHDYENYFYI